MTINHHELKKILAEKKLGIWKVADASRISPYVAIRLTRGYGAKGDAVAHKVYLGLIKLGVSGQEAVKILEEK
jgi:hypothetical protein